MIAIFFISDFPSLPTYSRFVLSHATGQAIPRCLPVSNRRLCIQGYLPAFESRIVTVYLRQGPLPCMTSIATPVTSGSGLHVKLREIAFRGVLFFGSASHCGDRFSRLSPGAALCQRIPVEINPVPIRFRQALARSPATRAGRLWQLCSASAPRCLHSRTDLLLSTL